MRHQSSLKIRWNMRDAIWREIDGELLIRNGVDGCCVLEEAASWVDLIEADSNSRIGLQVVKEFTDGSKRDLDISLKDGDVRQNRRNLERLGLYQHLTDDGR